ncbi:MAG: C10 family peptidase, partial [Sediminibacterium sp.]|nr:C10 family peptidase [Sediminibacterium sp.]
AKLVATNFIKQEMYFKKNAVLKDSQTKFLDYNKYEITPTSSFTNINNVFNTQNQQFSSEEPVINQIIHFDDEFGQPVFYAVNFLKPKCFTIVSATKKDESILSFVNGDNFSLESANPAYLDLLNSRAAKIKAYNYNEIGYDTSMSSWSAYGINDSFDIRNPDLFENKKIGESIRSAPPTENDPVTICSDRYTHTTYIPYNTIINTLEQIGPVTGTQWNQNDPYNTFSRKLPSCTKLSPVGCVAVAIGQIVKYIKRNDYLSFTYSGIDHLGYDFYYSGINYNRMPYGKLGTVHDSSTYQDANYPGVILPISRNTNEISNVAKMLRVAGIMADADYGCESTGASNYVKSFNFLLGRTNVELGPYSRTSVIISLRGAQHYPVFMTVWTDFHSTWGYGVGSGHAWMCEGLKTEQITTHYRKNIYIERPVSRYLYSTNSNCIYQRQEFLRTEYISLIHTRNLFYMNWGWGGLSDGWFIGDDVRAGENDNFRFCRKLITL